jgi:tetratricopeptide (TPR) repeat protein
MRWSWLLLLALGCTLTLTGAVQAQEGAQRGGDRVTRLLARGQASARAGDTLSALGYYRDAISAGPRRSEGYVALGELYLTLEEPVRALEVFEAGVRASQGGEPLYLGLAATLQQLGQTERALDVLRRLRGLSPSALGLRRLAEAAEARGAFVEALATRRALLEQLTARAEPADQTEQAAERAQVRALELLLGSADRVRARSACSADSLVQRALARCP